MVTSATTVASPKQVIDITPVAWTYSKEINNDQVAVMDWMMQQCSLGSLQILLMQWLHKLNILCICHQSMPPLR